MTAEHKTYLKQNGLLVSVKIASWVGCLLLVGAIAIYTGKVIAPEKWVDYLNTKFITTVMNLAFFNGSLILFNLAIGRFTIEQIMDIRESNEEEQRIALYFLITYMLCTAFCLYLSV